VDGEDYDGHFEDYLGYSFFFKGYFLLYESMLPSILSATRYLKPEGIVIPEMFTMSLAGIEIQGEMEERVRFWDDVYGFKMNAMKDSFFTDAQVEIIPEEHILTSSKIIKVSLL
jgi:hypothetical protein